MNCINHFLRFNQFLLLGLIATLLLGACSSDDEMPTPDPGPEDTNKKTGFVIAGTTSSNSVLVKYFDQLPSGTVDLSDGKDFQRFFPTALYDHAMFMTRPDGSSGFSKMVVDENGEIIEEGSIPTIEGGSFRIAVKDSETGIFHDRATPNTITVYNPTTLEITGSIDMSAGMVPGDVDQRYQRFIFRGDDFFAPIRENGGASFNGFYLHHGNVSTRSYVGSTGIDAHFSGGVLTINNFGQNLVDESGNLYVQDGGAIGSGTFAKIYKIPAGSNEIDPNYVFEPVKLVNPMNIFYPTMNGFRYVGNGIGIAKVNTEVPAEVIATISGLPGNTFDEKLQALFGDPQLLGQVQADLFMAETSFYCELDLVNLTVTRIDDLPVMGAATVSVSFEHNGDLYIPVAKPDEQAYYKYTPGTGTATKAFDISGADIVGVYNLENNN